MIHLPSRYSFVYDNFGANPSLSAGTAVTPGASNVEGSFTQVASSANIAQDICCITLHVFQGSTGTQQKDHLLDIGVDPAGGTSYTEVIRNIVCGSASQLNSGIGSGHRFMFPLFIKAGSSVAVRIQGSNATAGTVRVLLRFYGQPSAAWQSRCGSFSETIGTITNSQGVAFTPGNAADGTYVSLGTTVKAMWWWQLGYQLSQATMTAGHYTYVELAHGDATNKHTIIRLMHGQTSSEEIASFMNDNLIAAAAYKPLPAGINLYVRGRCSAAPNSTYNAVAIGIGG